MKRLNYFQVHKNKKPKKLPFYISRETIRNATENLQHHLDLIASLYENPF